MDARFARDVTVLRDTGIIQDNALSRPAARLIEPLASPEVLISVEISELETTRVFTVWRNSAGVTLGTSIGPETFALRMLSPSTLPFDLAAALGLQVRPGRTSTPQFWDPGEMAHRSEPPGRRWRASTVWTSSDGSVCDHSIEMLDDAASYWEITGMDRGRLFLATPRSFDDVLRLLADLDPLG